MEFRSKKDPGFFITVIAPVLFVTTLYFVTVSKVSPIVYVILGLLAIFWSWIWFGTKYHIHRGDLLIQAGPIRKTISIDEIARISFLKNISLKSYYNGYSLSQNRITLYYGEHFDTVTISPENREEFLNMLTTYNPNIQLEKES